MKKKTNKPYIVAEIGVNHNGSFELAKKTIRAAAKSGADAVKFQMFHAEEFMSNSNDIYKYKTHKGTKSEDMFKMFKRLEFPYDWHDKLFKFSKSHKIDFFSTAGSEITADFLIKKKVKFIKISSPDLTNYPLLKHIAKYKKKTIVSTGMGSIDEIDKAVEIFKKYNAPIILLHCVSMYPAPFKDSNLLRILELKKRYREIEIGYSDHTLGSEASIVAASLGATLIEKHFTLSKKLIGPDHLISCNPIELKNLVSKVKEVDLLLGNKSINPSLNEKRNRLLFRRSITVKKSIKKNEKFSKHNLCLRRPEKGMHPKFLQELIGKKSKENLKKDHKVKLSDIK